MKKLTSRLVVPVVLLFMRCIGRIPKKSCRIFGLQYIAQNSLDKGKLEKARRQANELLALSEEFQNDFMYGNAIHHANILLGRIYLKEGNIDQAKKKLIQAGETPGSPQLNSFGPSMVLAKELLEKNESNIVLEYFTLCSLFWKNGQLDVWKQDVKKGKPPNFKANLL